MSGRFRLVALLFGMALHGGAQSLEELSGIVRGVTLDPGECYRVRELNFSKEDLRIYLTEGHLIFSPPVHGTRIAAVFTAEKAEAGDAEVLLFPPYSSERRSLARYLKSPNLNEHFQTAVILAADGSLDRLWKELQSQTALRQQPEIGQLLTSQWNSVIQNLGQSFEIRFLQDLLTPQRSQYGFFYMTVMSPRVGNFDIFHDPRTPEQFLVGRLEQKENTQSYDVWTAFKSRPFRTGERAAVPVEAILKKYEIEATLTDDLKLFCNTKVTFSPTVGSENVLALDISRQMRVTEVSIDGQPAQFLHHESLRANLLRGHGNDTFLVVPSTPLKPGATYTMQLHHEGNVVTDAGNNVYFVGSRGIWYPNRGLQFSDFELVFRTPKSLSLVAAGDLLESLEESDWRITRHRTTHPIRLLGFNLGEYQRIEVTKSAFTIEVCANRRSEKALEGRGQRLIIVPQSPPWTRAQRRPPEFIALPDPLSGQSVRIRDLGNQVGEAYSWMAENFGMPPWNRLIVSPIPGNFGQGFPGLVYISTLSYLRDVDPALASRPPLEQMFFQELLPVHETAHQWWGNTVAPEAHQDEWLMEALSDYTALMFLEKRRGRDTLADFLASYRTRLLEKSASGETLESFGPIVWGSRLHTSQSPQSWQVITYQKGAWIMHMLRGAMGDASFLRFLAAIRRDFEYKTISTEQFRKLAMQHLPADYPEKNLESLFQQYVFDTGIPTLRLDYQITGRAPSIKVRARVIQSDVREDFSVLVPIEVHPAKGPPIKHWLYTGDEETVLELKLSAPPSKISLDPHGSMLFVRN